MTQTEPTIYLWNKNSIFNIKLRAIPDNNN